MQQLIYISTAHSAVDSGEVAEILKRSRHNNFRHGITGLLVLHRDRFMQALEGPVDAVRQTFANIKADSRHRAVVTLYHRDVDRREFGEWPMAYPEGVANDGAALVDAVDRLVAHVSDHRLRAMFSSFARLERVAA